MALKPGGAKQKGADGERELANLLVGIAATVGVKLDLNRNLEQTRGGGHDLVGLEIDYGLAVEVKRVEAMALNSWWAQAVRQAKVAGCDPVLAWRQNRQPWRFRIRGYVWPCGHELDIDLELAQFTVWFKSRLGK
jgi:Holliday junction resolvase